MICVPFVRHYKVARPFFLDKVLGRDEHGYLWHTQPFRHAPFLQLDAGSKIFRLQNKAGGGHSLAR
jgi:hypothetical protein